ncbi:6-phosphofructokinase [Clostridium aminobutyricum]|uniref:ATP-dependent 6-phosphofructokinase n=1 Tax=Clostridium aminobutyricum TaxID=33953 RepID=A0A939D5W6_CLOAM|nr:6-phosphofructokinase [Clostridium aminobutyricum]MBN7771999.1 6-phosphofructokinase [Clostridium aminobutyricum]
MKKIGVLTSGGDSPGMNAAIRAAVRGAIYLGMEVYGIDKGYEGLIDGEIEPMTISSVSDILQRGGTILRTARSERFMTTEGQKRAISMLENFNIDSLVIVGGDGSLKGGLDLHKQGITVMGLPGTIDNDLGYTDYTIGFDTAVNTVLSAISNIRDTSSSHERTTVIEVMGRHCGDIALYAGLTGGAETILIPEVPVDINAICRKMVQGRNRGKLHNIIIKAEGIDLSTQELADILKERTGMETKIVVLGYIQRGGSPTARDRMLASRMAYKAVELLAEGSESRAIGINGNEIVQYPLADALKMTREYDKDVMKLADILSI